MNEKIDVLAVVRRHAESHRALAESDAYSAQEAPRLEAAMTAIAELIEADKEYDEAYAAAVANPAKEAWLADAEERRAAALARVGGA